jgi:lipopolysaccharide/colanic/teichoic acid biosynthesis glycosyltransferase
MSKRLMDVSLSLVLLILAAPVILAAMIVIFAHDRGPAIYWARRVGRDGRDFRMAKLRTMTVGADLCEGPSAGRSDKRITPPGHALRRWKIDELPQLWNVLIGEMSLVGPRPSVRRGGVDRYTPEELHLLDARPGLTDLSSIVFSDQEAILEGAPDPDARYERVIRPWKSRLGLLYLRHRTLWVDIRLVALTAVAILAKRPALLGVDRILAEWGAEEDLRRVCRRDGPLPWAEPPGLRRDADA